MHCEIRDLFFFLVNPKCSESDGSGVANVGNLGRGLVDDRQLFKGALGWSCIVLFFFSGRYPPDPKGLDRDGSQKS